MPTPSPRTHPVVKAAAALVVLASGAAGVWVGSRGGVPKPLPVADVETRALPAADTADPHLAAADSGRQLFEQRCAKCHNVGGGPRKEGPDLADVAARRDLRWTRAMIARPYSMFRTDSLAQWVLKVHGMKPDQVSPDDPDLRALTAYFGSFDLGR
jgi:mono/diheme cytochrome c family protein